MKRAEAVLNTGAVLHEEEIRFSEAELRKQQVTNTKAIARFNEENVEVEI